MFARRRRASAREVKTTSNKQHQAKGECLQIQRLADDGLLLDTRGLKNLSEIPAKTNNPSEKGPYPLDLDAMECRKKGMTCPMALVMAPRLEKTTRRSKLSIFGSYNMQIFDKQRTTLLKWVHIHWIRMRQGAEIIGRHARWSLLCSRGPKRPKELSRSVNAHLCSTSHFKSFAWSR
jgi:hypothetical protein